MSYLSVAVATSQGWETKMYLIKWNKDESKLEASLGGHITFGEAQVFTEEIIRELQNYCGEHFTYELDYSAASKVDDGVLEALQVAQTYCKLRGAEKYVCVARNEIEIEYMTGLRLQQVLEGAETYVLPDVKSA